MFGTENRPIGVIVNLNELWPPPEQQREAIRKEESHHHLKAGRPAFDRPDRCSRPVERTDAFAHLATSREKVKALATLASIRRRQSAAVTFNIEIQNFQSKAIHFSNGFRVS